MTPPHDHHDRPSLDLLSAGRPTGLPGLQYVPWGTHICQFYEERQDLLDIALPYFQAGLDANELCLWAASDPVDAKHATSELERAMPNAQSHLETGRIEIVSAAEWYLTNATFDEARVIEAWKEKVGEALGRGFAGVRALGDESWLTQQTWTQFAQYESALDRALAGEPMLVLCCYALKELSGSQVFEVARSHDFMIVRRQGKTEILETTESVGAKAALEQLNKRLETLLAERNARLADVRQELHEREAIYRFIAENINEIIAVFQADGKRDYISDSAVRVLGNIPPEDFSGVHPNDLPRVNASFAKVVAGEEDTLTFRHRHNDGSWRWLEFTGKPAKFDGMPYVIGVGRDVTERVKLEEQLHHSQKMEALGRFAGGVSHDFNNLLTAIYGYAELVAGEVPNNSAAYDNVREIQRATDRAQGVTRQLLTFSRREVLQPQAIDLVQVVNRMERMLRLLLREDVQFAIRRCRLPLVVLVDPTQIEQLVVNLVSNARDATPANGTIEVICDEVVQDGAKSAVAEFVPPGTYARLRVTDSGSGMPAEVVDKAFDPFFTTKPPGVGTGLGLSTVFGIVRQAKGHVWIDSEEGAGTTVVVLLPLAAGTAELPRRVPRSGRGDRLEGKAVMVVEDEDMVRSFVEQALHRHGAKVTALADPVVAIERLSDPETRVDVLVSDVIMPGLSGPQLAERAQRLRPGLPVVLMSGYTADESLLRDAQQGWPLLEKPFRPDELVELIRRAIPPASSSRPSKSRRRRANRSTAGPE